MKMIMNECQVNRAEDEINYLFVTTTPVNCRLWRTGGFTSHYGDTSLLGRNSIFSIDNARRSTLSRQFSHHFTTHTTCQSNICQITSNRRGSCRRRWRWLIDVGRNRSQTRATTTVETTFIITLTISVWSTFFIAVGCAGNSLNRWATSVFIDWKKKDDLFS